MSKSKLITGRDIIEAIKKNGFNHSRGRWFGKSDKRINGQYVRGSTVITSACVMGQAAINLGVDYTSLSKGEFNEPTSKMITLNDHRRLSYPELVAEAEKLFAPYLDTTISAKEKIYNAKRKGE